MVAARGRRPRVSPRPRVPYLEILFPLCGGHRGCLQCHLSLRGGDRAIRGRAVRVVVAAKGDGALRRDSDTGTVPAGTLECCGVLWGAGSPLWAVPGGPAVGWS